MKELTHGKRIRIVSDGSPFNTHIFLPDGQDLIEIVPVTGICFALTANEPGVVTITIEVHEPELDLVNMRSVFVWDKQKNAFNEWQRAHNREQFRQAGLSRVN